MSKLGIGTAQFGQKYGIANQLGAVEQEKADKIINFALANHITTIDTASGYGNSEYILGRAMETNSQAFSIVTKTPHINLSDRYSSGSVRGSFFDSLEKLKVKSCYGLLVHQPDLIYSKQFDLIWGELEALKADGYVQKIGCSVYEPLQLEYWISSASIDIVQFPLNLLDQRFIDSGILTRLRRSGVELHARSFFLQGLLLMDSDKLPPFFKPIKSTLVAFEKLCKSHELTKLQGLFCFAKAVDNDFDKLIIGVDSLNQLKQLLEEFNIADSKLDFKQFSIIDTKFLNPSNWQVEDC